MEGIPEAVFAPVRDAVDRALNGKRRLDEDLTEQVRIAARRAANDVWGKKPVVRVQTAEV